jgi:GST-like protein
MARNGFRGAFNGPHPAQAHPAQILKRNQEETSADRALLLAAAENGWKISIMLRECGLPYNVIPVNLLKGEQAQVSFDLS